jgi:hypothetical protein
MYLLHVQSGKGNTLFLPLFFLLLMVGYWDPGLIHYLSIS